MAVLFNKIKWKKINRTIEVPFCPYCKQELLLNKIGVPYYCKCGYWEYNAIKDNFNIIKEDDYIK